jgi:hypothetical protein
MNLTNVNVLFGRGGKPSCNAIIIAEFCDGFSSYDCPLDVTFVCQKDHRDRCSIIQCYFLSQIAQPLYNKTWILKQGETNIH